MSNIRELLTLPENLLWAWRKTVRLYAMTDGIYDQRAIAAFELDLEKNLESIRRDFQNSEYKTEFLSVLPQPKKPDDQGHPRMRQSFQVSVRDQVAWIAVANAIGPLVDEQMPAWSYGHRLYRSVWFAEEADNSDRHSRLCRGPYRHADGYMYRKFQHSWPLFRRHLSLTARNMVRGKNDEDVMESKLDDAEIRALRQGESLRYLQRNFWPARRTANTELFYASIDLEKFYPKISTASIMNGFEKSVLELTEDTGLKSLLRQMLNFQVSTEHLPKELLGVIEPETFAGKFDGIPTGLMAAGFLSNVAMFPVDKEVEGLLDQKRDIAHFRFVDDHAILAYDFDNLLLWIKGYEDLLKKHGIGSSIHKDKCDPEGLKEALWGDNSSEDELKIKIRNECKIDGAHPSKLMTRTLGQVSTLAAVDFDILTDPDKHQRLEQLEWLLLADIPEREIRADTRVAFAAGKISVLAPEILIPNEDLLKENRIKALKEITLKGANPVLKKTLREQIAKINERVKALEKEEEKKWSAHISRYFSLLFQAFTEHPDKIRLFARLLSYSQRTGYNGFKEIEKWLVRNKDGESKHLCIYLKSLALQILAQQVLLSAKIYTSEGYLHSQILAAYSHLSNVSNLNLSVFYGVNRDVPFFQRESAQLFAVCLKGAALIIERHSPGMILGTNLKKMALKLLPINLTDSSDTWNDVTGTPLGVWVHLMENTISPLEVNPSAIWSATAKNLNPSIHLDWNNLRRFPQKLPNSARKFLLENPHLIDSDDEGWLLEVARAEENNLSWPEGESIEPIIKVKNALNSSRDMKYIKLSTWINKIKEMDKYDPRASEWTALEIIRQILLPIFEVGGKLSQLDFIHPENILIPEGWLSPPRSLVNPHFGVHPQ